MTTDRSFGMDSYRHDAKDDLSDRDDERDRAERLRADVDEAETQDELEEAELEQEHVRERLDRWSWTAEAVHEDVDY